MKITKILLCASVLTLFYSCAPEEGKGGLASIQGVVMTQNINTLGEKSGAVYPAADEDVYISYGNSGLADDKEATSFDGSYKFSNLTKGDYTVFVYSDDTASNAKYPKLVCSQKLSLEGKKDEAKADMLTIYKHVDYDDGNGIVSGYVKEIVQDGNLELATINGVDIDVYLQYQNSEEILDRYRTDANGKFVISHLIPGNYRLYALTETLFKHESDTAVIRDFQIKDNFSQEFVDTIFIRNY